MSRLIRIYDTTLRDGTQGEGVSFSSEDKVRLTSRLDALGIHYIEGGWPGSNPKDLRFFRRMQDVTLKHAKLAAFSMTRRAGGRAEGDPNMEALIDAGVDLRPVRPDVPAPDPQAEALRPGDCSLEGVLDAQRVPSFALLQKRGRLTRRADVSRAALEEGLKPVIDKFGMETALHDQEERMKVLLMVSRFGHCLNDLLYRWQTGDLSAEIVAVASPYDDLAAMAATYGVRYLSLPGTDAGQDVRDRSILGLVESERADLVVLARYMQVLGPDACAALEGRAINIHHSFLPSFKGAKPYHQAHERGVKIIGAAAHYETPDLDEGPIIEQETARVTHAMTPDDLIAVGRDIESRVLAGAVKSHLESRVMLNGHKTVVFA